MLEYFSKNANKLFRIFTELPDTRAHKFIRKKKYRKFIMQSSPIQPKGGESFLYKSECSGKNITISDQYYWRQSKTISYKNGIVKVNFYIKESRVCH